MHCRNFSRAAQDGCDGRRAASGIHAARGVPVRTVTAIGPWDSWRQVSQHQFPGASSS